MDHQIAGRLIIIMGSELMINPEPLYQQSIKEAMAKLQTLRDIDLVIGIPFYNEQDTLPDLLRTIDRSLVDSRAGDRVLILSVGDPASSEWFGAVEGIDLRSPHAAILMQPGSNGRGASIRIILEIAAYLEADAVILAADLYQMPETEPDIELSASDLQFDLYKSLIDGIIEPLRNGYDLVLTSFVMPYWSNLVSGLFTAPVLEFFYGCEVRDPSSGIYGISYDLIQDYQSEIRFWFESVRGYGIDAWLLTRAIRWGKKLCEVELGSRQGHASWAKLSYVFKETARCLFECIKHDEDFWAGGRKFLASPDRSDVRDTGILGALNKQEPYSYAELVDQFKRSCHDYWSLYELAMPESERAAVKRAVSLPLEEFRLEGGLWADMVYCWLSSYWFNKDVLQEDMLNALASAFGGRVADVLERVHSLRERAVAIPGVNPAELITGEAQNIKREQIADFRHFWRSFLEQWSKKASAAEPRLIPAYSLEFIPGKPIMLPEVLPVHGKKTVPTKEIFYELQQRHQKEFNQFLHQGLQVPENASSSEVITSMQKVMARLEEILDHLFPGDLNTGDGVKQVVYRLFEVFAPGRVLAIKTDVLRDMLFRFRPVDLLIAGGFTGSQELIDRIGVRDAASLSLFSLGVKSVDRIQSWLLDNLRPDTLEEVDLQPLILDAENLIGPVTLGHISRLDKMAARVLVGPLAKGMGGEYPKLRYCLYIARQIGMAENYSTLWQDYAREKRNLGLKVKNSLAGHYETRPFSADNILESFHHRSLVKRLKALSQELVPALLSEEARSIQLMVEGYGLGQVLDDGTFMPCSAWTWASFSYKGGRGLPTPLSSRVEEQWFVHELLEEIYHEAGYDRDEIWKQVVQLIGEGRGDVDLFDTLSGKGAGDVTVIIQEAQDYPRAKMLVRYPGNPILRAIGQHPWEGRYVLNPGVVRIGDRVYLLYRAVGDDGVSRLGLAVTDGLNVLERLPDPIFTPQDEKEKRGIEDPRLVLIDQQIYMLYTAYDGVTAQIAAASIKVDDFLNRRFERWERRGRAFEDIWDKDAVIFPEKINGRYALYHRIEPSIWLTYMDNLQFPCPNVKHAIIMGPRLGGIWDSAMIGAGAQPIKTRYGWLLIYHGVDGGLVYRLGVILVDLNNPERLLYRSPNPILAPETEFEQGRDGEVWVHNVVFTCGAAPARDKNSLDADDEVLVYYGAADTYICVATATVGDLIPEAARHALKNE